MADRSTVKDQTIERLAEKIMQEPNFNAKIQDQLTEFKNKVVSEASEIIQKQFADWLSKEDVRKLAKLVAKEVVAAQLADKDNIQMWATHEIVTNRIKNQFEEHTHDDRFKKPLTDHIHLVHGHTTAHEHLKEFINARIQEKLDVYEKVIDKRARYIFQNETVKNYRFWLPIAISIVVSLISLAIAIFKDQAGAGN